MERDLSNGGFRSHEFTLAKPGATHGASPHDQTLRDPLPDESTAQEEHARIAGLVQTLPLDQCEAVTLYYFDRWPLERVATTMERSPEQIAELLLSAARTLRERLGKA